MSKVQLLAKSKPKKGSALAEPFFAFKLRRALPQHSPQRQHQL